MEDEAVCEIELTAAIQVLSETAVKLERHVVALQATNRELVAKNALLTRLVDSHEHRLAALEAKQAMSPRGASFDA